MPDPTEPPAPPPAAKLAETRSGRRLTPLRRALYGLAVPVAMALVRFWWLTCRIVKVTGNEHLDAALAGGPAVIVYWHQHQLFCVRHLLRQRNEGLKLAFAMSPSVDGEIPAMLARWVGARPLRGSSTYEGARALRDYYVALREGFSTAITTDGPTGPRYKMKPGAILLAQMSGRPMVSLSFHASRAWKFRAWDRFILPWPFARISIAVGKPWQVPKGLDAAALIEWQGRMERDLLEVYETARAALDT